MDRRIRFAIIVLVPAAAVAIYGATLIEGRTRPSEVSFAWAVAFVMVFAIHSAAVALPDRSLTRATALGSITTGILAAIVTVVIYISDALNHQITDNSQALRIIASAPMIAILGTHLARWAFRRSQRLARVVVTVLIVVGVYYGMVLVASTQSLPTGDWLQKISAWAPSLLLAPALFTGIYLVVTKISFKGNLDMQILIVIIVLGFVLRITGVMASLPYRFHPDEGMYVDDAMRLIRTGEFEPYIWHNPPLFHQLLSLIYLVYYAIGKALGGGEIIDRMTQVVVMYPTPAYVIGRLASGVLGTICMPLAYLIGRDIHNRSSGLLAALILAVSFGHVRDSHYATNDVMLSTLVLGTVFFALRYRRSFQIEWLISAFYFGGLCVATKYNGVVAFTSPVIAGMISLLSNGVSIYRTLQRLFLAAAISAVLIIFSLPFIVKNANLYLHGALSQFELNSRPWFGQSHRPSLFLWFESLPVAIGWFAVGMSIVGLIGIFVLRDNNRIELQRVFVFLAFPITYLFLLSTTNLYFVRFGIPLIPFIAILAGIGMDIILSRARSPLRLAALVVLSIALIAQPLLLSIRYNHLMFQTDTRVLADRWIQENLSSDDLIAVEAYAASDHQLNSWRYRFSNKVASPRYDLVWNLGEISLADLRKRQFDFIAVSSWTRDRWTVEGQSPLIYRRLEQDYIPVAVFHPGLGDTYLDFRLDEIYGPYWHISNRQAPGPSVWIYRLVP